MDSVPKDKILETRPDELYVVRKMYGLEKPGAMQDAISILHQWVQKQAHFRKKDFNPFYLETTITASKGSIERAKTQLDKICTWRTLLPHFFGNYNIKTDFGDIHNVAQVLTLPKSTEDHYRIFLCKFNGTPSTAGQVLDFYRLNIIHAEYLKIHDYLTSFMIILDLSEVNVMDYVTKINPVELRQAMSIYIEGYGMRVKAIHIISPSKVIDTLVLLLKQVLNPKVANRINVHKSIEDLLKAVPKNVLPRDYGGEERPIKDILDDWIEVLSSEEHLNHILEMNAAATDESSRQRETFVEQYAGMPGTFRLLSVD